MVQQERTLLFAAANAVRKSIENSDCSYFYSLLGLNNLYFVTLYKHIEQQSFDALPASANDQLLKETFMKNCHAFCTEERQSAPFSYGSKQADFLHNLYEMLNIPAFETEIQKPQSDPALLFTQKLWQNYKTNWQAQRLET